MTRRDLPIVVPSPIELRVIAARGPQMHGLLSEYEWTPADAAAHRSTRARLRRLGKGVALIALGFLVGFLGSNL